MGYSATSLEEAKDSAAKDAILYMATDQRKILKDYHYDELQKQKKMIKRLQCKLEKRNNQLVKAIAACDVLIDKVSESNKQIQDIVSKNLTPGHTATHSAHNACLLAVQNVVAELKRHEDKAMGKLKDTGAYPLYADLSGDNGSSDSDKERIQNNEYDLRYNSDGEELYEEEALRYGRD